VGFLKIFNPDALGKNYDAFVDSFFRGVLHGAIPKSLAVLSLFLFVYFVTRRRANMAIALLLYIVAFVLAYLTNFFSFLM